MKSCFLYHLNNNRNILNNKKRQGGIIMAFLIGVGGMTLAVVIGTSLLLYIEKKQKK